MLFWAVKIVKSCGLLQEAFSIGLFVEPKDGALAVLDIMEEEHLVENAAKVGSYLISELKKLIGSYHVVDVRGEGLMIGIELDIPYKEPRTRLIKEEHCFTGCSGTNVIRLLPPLCLSMDEAQQFIEKFKRVLA